MSKMIKEVLDELQMKKLGESIGRQLSGGETIELTGDIGAGKTTLTKGIAVGLGVDEDVQSPSFTINRMYEGRDNLTLAHYDFYRLNDAGIMANEISETIDDKTNVTIIEWADVVQGVLPDDRITIYITSPTESSRVLNINADGDRSRSILELIK